MALATTTTIAMAVLTQQPVSAQVVGNAFVKLYILHHSLKLVYRFYQDKSKLFHPKENGSMSISTTMQAIKENIVSLNYVHFRAEIKSVDAQESFNVAITTETAVVVATQQPASVQVVGNAFVQLYYHILHHSLRLVHRFYQDIRKTGHPKDNGSMSINTTMQAINEKIVSHNYVHFRAEIKYVDAHESFNDTIAKLRTGSVKMLVGIFKILMKFGCRERNKHRFLSKRSDSLPSLLVRSFISDGSGNNNSNCSGRANSTTSFCQSFWQRICAVAMSHTASLNEAHSSINQDTSKLGHPKDNGSMSISTTMQAINEKIVSINYVHFRAEIKSVDAQESFNGGVHDLDISKLCHPKENGFMSINTTMQAIKDNSVSLNYVHFRAEIKSVDAQSLNGRVTFLSLITDGSGNNNSNWGGVGYSTTSFCPSCWQCICAVVLSHNASLTEARSSILLGHQVEIKSVDAQESFNVGVYVLVTCYLIGKDNKYH
ncbi:hypothetical protein BUALT_Bualt05G0042100 [Buddleja alternifolia]|uniref:NTF2 domain-containing protein n=1 Tax=Buddleja alternifolia TaxID=168488 RepID=A0AAV6XID5_9LAMI|nr:hypothetical protein BUALT_Bualt05G0042100 [Buddleja alternifolia]